MEGIITLTVRNVELVQVSTATDGKASDRATIELTSLLCVRILRARFAFVDRRHGHGSFTEASDESFERAHSQASQRQDVARARDSLICPCLSHRGTV